MDPLDLLIVIAAGGYAFSGYRRGLSWVGMSMVGLMVGILLGAVVAPWLAHRLISGGSAHSQTRALVATALFLFFIFTCQGLGAMAGLHMRVRVLRTEFVEFDSVGGGIVGFFGVIFAAWYVGLSFANSPFPLLDQQINGSGIIRTLAGVVPNIPGPIAALTRIISSPDNFSGAFSNVNPSVQIPASINTPGVTAAAQDTYRVVSTITSSDCAGIESGSGWPINATHIVSNAHVVAGGTHVVVDAPSGASLRGVVVYFDPEIDISVIYVPGAQFTPLKLSTTDPDPSTIGAVIGYPAGGDEQVAPAAVRGVENARSSDIYSSNTVTRSIEVLAAHIVPGNSGGPMVNASGTVIGVVFAASTSNESEGYALAQSQVVGDINVGANLTRAVDTQGCVNG